MALAAHLRSNAHKDLSDKQRQALRHKLIGLRTKPQQTDRQLERDMAKDVGINQEK